MPGCRRSSSQPSLWFKGKQVFKIQMAQNDAVIPVATQGVGVSCKSYTARRLTELLPTVDLPDSFLQWQAQLLSNYSGHVFVPHGVETSTPTLWQAVLESSLSQLSMQAEITELRSQNEFLKSEQQRLESEIKEGEARSREQDRLIQRLTSNTVTERFFTPGRNGPLRPGLELTRRHTAAIIAYIVHNTNVCRFDNLNGARAVRRAVDRTLREGES